MSYDWTFTKIAAEGPTYTPRIPKVHQSVADICCQCISIDISESHTIDRYHFSVYPLVKYNVKIENDKVLLIYTSKMVIVHSFVSLPEGNIPITHVNYMYGLSGNLTNGFGGTLFQSNPSMCVCIFYDDIVKHIYVLS